MHLRYSKEDIFRILMFRDHAGCNHKDYVPDEIIRFTQNGIHAERFDKTWFICNDNNIMRYIWHRDEVPNIVAIFADMFVRIIEWINDHGMKSNYRFYDEHRNVMLITAIPEVAVPDETGELIEFFDVPHPKDIKDEDSDKVFVDVDTENFMIDIKAICNLVVKVPRKAIF